MSLRLYALAGAALAGAAGFGYLTHLRASNASLAAALAAERGKYAQCLASIDVAREDRRRRDEIDRIPDHGLRDAGREWLLAPGPDAGPAAGRP